MQHHNRRYRCESDGKPLYRGNSIR